ncbi:unnamed protein product [Spodoptera exigua]|nr:unnamed protein product [Spodoptera exigua]
MEGVKKWLTERNPRKNGMYVHYSPPKLVGAVSAAQLRQWARGGAESRLERAVLAGQGRRLLAETEGLSLSNHLPTLVAKCDALHAAVEKGSLLELQELLESDYNRRKYVMCRDEAGVGLLHKAVFYDYMDIAEYLVRNYPQLVHQKDSEGRTPLHYSAVSRDSASLAALLEGAGAARGARDAAGRTPAHYRGQARELLALPDAMARDNKNAAPAQARHHCYLIRRVCSDAVDGIDCLVIKRHNIRIWCHDCDMARLQRVVWEGHGSRLLSEVSNQPVVKKFLEAVPYIMNTIRDIHAAVVQNDLEGLMKHAGDPVPPQALSSRDANNMTVMHKAAGLGHGGILKYIAERYPQGINDVDNDGRTPLHYAAAMRDDQHTYNTLVSLGADESVVDNKNKTPAYYINRPQEIDKNMFKTLPDAPRTPSSAYPNSWDWKLLDTEVIAELNKKSRRKNHKASNENISSKDTNTNTISESTDNRIGGMKGSSTHELINNLPELDDAKQTKDDIENHIANVESNKESDVVEETHEQEQENEQNAEETEDKQDHASDAEEAVENAEEHAEEPKEPEEVVENTVNESNGDKPADDEKPSEDIEENPAESEEIAENKEQIHENADKENKDHEAANEENEKSEIETEAEKNNAEEFENNETEQLKDNDNVHEHSTDNDGVEQKTEDNGPDEDSKPELHDNEPKEETQNNEMHNNEHEKENHRVESAKPISQHEEDNKDNESNHDENESNADAEDFGAASNEGNTNGEHTEDDDDVQVQGETQSEYSDSHLKSTAELPHLGSAKRGNVTDGRSTQESLIEGVVNGEAEMDSQDASMTQRDGSLHGEVLVVDNEIDPEVTDLINNANMEMLATLVLNGEGSRLIGRHSRNSELQAFLDNVPTYMNGKSAEEYQKNPTLLPFHQMLSDYGISEDAAQSMFSDKVCLVPEDQVSSRRALDTPEALDTLERCYHLLASARPARTPLSASSNRATPPLVLARFLKKPIFDIIKYRITKLDHDLFDVIWPAVKKLPDSRNIIQTVEEDFPGGITAPDYYVYDVFNEFLIPLVKDLHNINVNSELPTHPKSNFMGTSSAKLSSEPLVEINIDPNDEFILSGVIECSRNLEGFELPLNLKVGKLETIERIVTTLLMKEEFSKFCEFANPESDQKGGTYYTMNEVLEKPSEICATLASSGLLIALCDREEIDDCARLHGKHWPYGRGVFVTDDRTVAVWINVHDHIRVLVSSAQDSPGEIGLPFSKLSYIMTYLHEKLDFTWDTKLGYLSARPTFLGAGIRFSLIVNFPGLSKDPDNMKHLCAMRGLQYRETLSPEIARISNYQCLSVTETSCFNDFATATSNLLHLEKDLSMQNSAHIATMLSNIFRKKRNSITSHDSPEKREKY